MDTLTHALSGALLARMAAPARPAAGTPCLGTRVAAGFAGGVFPDIDFVARAVDTLWYLSEVHQGATHSLVLLPLWAFVVAWIFGRVTGFGWHGYYLPAALGLLIHIAGDVITAYGTMVLYPFSDWRPALGWTFVLDPCFTAIIVGGLLFAWVWPSRARLASAAALAGLVAYVGMAGMIQQRAVALGTAYAEARGLHDARVQALPQPFSPAHWLVIVTKPEIHHVARVRLLPGRSLADMMPLPDALGRLASHYSQTPVWALYPRFGWDPDERRIARLAWQQDGFRYFRRFARYPALNGLETEGGRMCAWFMDLRFTLPELPPSFVFGMCRQPGDGTWVPERRRGAMWLD